MFDGRLAAFGVHETISVDSTEAARCLTDGRNYLAAYAADNGDVSSFTRRGRIAPGRILHAIAAAFGTEIVSEYDPPVWGFATQEERDAVQEQIAKENRSAFYGELIQYLEGGANPYQPNQIGFTKMELGRQLASNDPGLILPANKGRLLQEIDAQYLRDHAVQITLSEEDIAAAKMAANLTSEVAFAHRAQGA